MNAETTRWAATQFVECDIHLMWHALSFKEIDRPYQVDNLISELGWDGVEIEEVERHRPMAGTLAKRLSLRDRQLCEINWAEIRSKCPGSSEFCVDVSFPWFPSTPRLSDPQGVKISGRFKEAPNGYGSGHLWGFRGSIVTVRQYRPKYRFSPSHMFSWSSVHFKIHRQRFFFLSHYLFTPSSLIISNEFSQIFNSGKVRGSIQIECSAIHPINPLQ
jgi:hypothetical protein